MKYRLIFTLVYSFFATYSSIFLYLSFSLSLSLFDIWHDTYYVFMIIACKVLYTKEYMSLFEITKKAQFFFACKFH